MSFYENLSPLIQPNERSHTLCNFSRAVLSCKLTLEDGQGHFITLVDESSPVVFREVKCRIAGFRGPY